MNLKIADEQFERLMKSGKFVDEIKKDQNIKKRVKELFREAYTFGFSDGFQMAYIKHMK